MSGHEDVLDVVVVGGGFGGIYALHRLRSDGLDVHLFEANDGVGGTWFVNRYPGARCDFPSLDYSYSFSADLQQDWDWPETYSTQPEILRYIEHVVDRFDLAPHITTGARVDALTFDVAASTWAVSIGGVPAARARYVVLAVGSLSAPVIPAVPGLEMFAGRVLHTGAWPQAKVDFAGRQVAVVGTGSSGVQVAPEIAGSAARLYVLQRTPSYVVPSPTKELSAQEWAGAKVDYPDRRRRASLGVLGVDGSVRPEGALEVTAEDREAEYARRWASGEPMFAFADLFVNVEANETLADFVRARTREAVDDAWTGERLSSARYPVGARRIVYGAGPFHEMFNRDNVTLVDLVDEPMTGVKPEGIVVGERVIKVDDIVFATGFDAVTGAFLAVPITGREGRTLGSAWADGPVTLVGALVHGFPNLMLLGGPGSAGVLTNVVASNEKQVDWIAGLIAHADAAGVRQVEATADAEAAWTAHVSEVAGQTIFTKARSWYLGDNIEGKPHRFMVFAGGYARFNEICSAVRDAGYVGLTFDGRPAPGLDDPAEALSRILSPPAPRDEA